MKFSGIIEKLSKDETVTIGSNEIFIGKKLNSIIGGVPIYDIVVSKDDKDTVFNSMDALDEASTIGKCDIRRCIMCDEIPEAGYYIDHELDQVYCSFKCLSKWMNDVYGEGGWKVVNEGFDTKYMIKMDEDDLYFYDDAVKKDGVLWRYYNIEYVPDCAIGSSECIDIDFSECFR